VGDMPGRSAGCLESNWEEFFAQLGRADLSGKRIALYGLGAQERYSDRFAASLIRVYQQLQDLGAEMIGSWSTEGYTFEHSPSIVDGHFVGLVIDERTQGGLTEQRIDSWLEQIKPALLEMLAETA
jgi:flavodoxin I